MNPLVYFFLIPVVFVLLAGIVYASRRKPNQLPALNGKPTWNATGVAWWIVVRIAVVAVVWLVATNWSGISASSSVLLSAGMFLTILIVLAGVAIFFAAIGYQKLGKRLGSIMILVVVAWILVVIWTPANHRPSWPRPAAMTSAAAGATQEKRFEDKIVLEKGKPVTIIVPVAPAWSPLITTTPRLFSETKGHSRTTGKIWMWRPNSGSPPIECDPNVRLHLTYSSVADFERRYQVAQGQEPTAIVVWID